MPDFNYKTTTITFNTITGEFNKLPYNDSFILKSFETGNAIQIVLPNYNQDWLDRPLSFTDQGDEVMLIYAGVKQFKDESEPSIMVNKTKNEYWIVRDAELLNKDLNIKFKTGELMNIFTRRNVLLSVTILLGGAVSLIPGANPIVGIAVAVSFALIMMTLNTKRWWGFNSKLNKHLKNLGELSIDNVN